MIGQRLLRLAQGLRRLLGLGNIPGDLRSPNDVALRIFDRRNRERKLNPASILPHTNAFKVVDSFTSSDALQNLWFFIQPVGWNQNRDWFSDDLFSRVAENPLRPFIPARDPAGQVLAHDGVVRRFDNGSQPGDRPLPLADARDIPNNQDQPNNVARFRSYRRRAVIDGPFLAVARD